MLRQATQLGIVGAPYSDYVDPIPMPAARGIPVDVTWGKAVLRAQTAREAVSRDDEGGAAPPSPDALPIGADVAGTLASALASYPPLLISEGVEPAERRDADDAPAPSPPAAPLSRDDPEWAARVVSVARAAGRHEQAISALSDRLDQVERRLETIEERTNRGDAGHAALADRVSHLESLAAVVEDLVAEQFRKSASELLSLPADIEGLYQELDSVAEVVTARDAAVVGYAERIVSLEQANHKLREEMQQVLAASAAATEATEDPPHDLEPATIDHLSDDPVAHANEKAIEVLNAELVRIHDSLRVLGGNGISGD